MTSTAQRAPCGKYSVVLFSTTEHVFLMELKREQIDVFVENIDGIAINDLDHFARELSGNPGYWLLCRFNWRCRRRCFLNWTLWRVRDPGSQAAATERLTRERSGRLRSKPESISAPPPIAFGVTETTTGSRDSALLTRWFEFRRFPVAYGVNRLSISLTRSDTQVSDAVVTDEFELCVQP